MTSAGTPVVAEREGERGPRGRSCRSPSGRPGRRVEGGRARRPARRSRSPTPPPSGEDCPGGCTGRPARRGRRRAGRRGPAARRGGRACSRASGPPRRTRPRRRPARTPRRLVGLLAAVVVVVVDARPRHGRRRAPRPSRPSHARFRSSPIASWRARSPLRRSPLHGRGHVVGEARRRRARARRVGGREDLVEADRLEQAERRLELRLGLAAEADDDVRADGDPRHGRADPRQALEVVRDRVLAAHPAQDLVVAGLDRQVERLADATGTRPSPSISRSERSHGCEVTNRRRGIAGPAVAVAERVDRPDQLGEVRPRAAVEPPARSGAPPRRGRSAPRPAGRGRSC